MTYINFIQSKKFLFHCDFRKTRGKWSIVKNITKLRNQQNNNLKKFKRA